MSEPKTPLPINDDFVDEDNSGYIKSFMFVKGFAIALGLEQTLKALAIARRMHHGQTRRDGTPYIVHPLKVCTTLINCGIRDDYTLAAALLHDVIEDCKDKLPFGGEELVKEYGVHPAVYHIIRLLSKDSGLDDYELSVYFNEIKKDASACAVKLADRFHNSQTLYTFKHDKLLKYIRETEMFILPMASYAKYRYTNWTNAFSILKTNISSLNHSMKIITQMYDAQIDELRCELNEVKPPVPVPNGTESTTKKS